MLDIMLMTSCRNIINIEHTASAVFASSLLVLPFRGGKNFTRFISKYCTVLTNLLYVIKNIFLKNKNECTAVPVEKFSLS